MAESLKMVTHGRRQVGGDWLARIVAAPHDMQEHGVMGLGIGGGCD